MRITRIISSSVALLFAVVRIGVAQNIVSNPGFETGDFSGWTQFGNPGFTGVDAAFPHTGTFAALFGPEGTSGGIFQALATTPGTTYTFSFWLLNEDSGVPAPDNFFEASWNGGSVFSLSNSDPFDYTLLTFDVLATGASTEITFSFRNEDIFWDLDDVSVIAATSAVPEPATMALVATGLVALAGLRRRSLTDGRSTGRGDAPHG